MNEALLDGRHVSAAPDGPDMRHGADRFLSSGWGSAGRIRLVQGGR
jgi:hypothetical protein